MRPLAGPASASGLYINENLTDEELLQMANELAERADVTSVYPNYLLQPKRVPNDPLYVHQWHYQAIDLESAWDITTGDPTGTVVAVLDTGILYSQTDPNWQHLDFANVLPGYDFISEWQSAGDGDGRDPDPFDVLGDGFHGTHVAGTIAAATNNNEGVAGVDWHARILPVRVLGDGGGSILDIMEGLLWAAGFDVQGVPKNNTPARVINMSLGGDGVCLPEMQSVFDAVANSGAIVVVASDNENEDTAGKFPASCGNIITVGATNHAGLRTSYSNYGLEVDIMAPGGDMTTNYVNPQYPDGVLSLGLDPGSGDIYVFDHGTSMAAPHVAGIISLMIDVKPDLDLYAAWDIITSAAWPLTAAECGIANGCGAGLINPEQALIAAQNYTSPSSRRPGWSLRSWPWAKPESHPGEWPNDYRGFPGRCQWRTL